jgi:hypothetical protein
MSSPTSPTSIRKSRTSFLLPLLFLLPLMAAPSSAWATGDANETSCPNEQMTGFESYLPDCRAYELVTPAFKDGFVTGMLATSPDGSRAIVESTGVFAGTQSGASALGARCLLSRSADGWETYPVSPPLSLFPAQEVFAASPSLKDRCGCCARRRSLCMTRICMCGKPMASW